VAADGATVVATDAAADDCADDDKLMCALPCAGTSTAQFVSYEHQNLWSIE